MSEKTIAKRVQPIDIEEVFRKKNPKLANILPGFVFRYLKRIIHEDFVNQFLEKHGEKRNLEFIEAAIEEFNVTIETEGTGNFKQSEKYIFAANHPLGGFDGIVLMKIISEYFSDFKFLVNDLLMNITPIADLFIPINKHGSQGAEAVLEMEKAFESDIQILTFPAGMVSRKIRGQVMDLKWQKNFIVKAKKYKRKIIPVHFSGRNTNFFYRLANFRKFLGIKANIEMLYLADETMKHRNKHLVIKFGKPIPWQTFDKTLRPIEWAKWVKEKVYAIDGVNNVPI
jgi:1-acyl-sn-glycerol-3-phosphate acyltransferase